MDPDHFVQHLGYPVEFLQSLLVWLRAHEIHDQVAVPVSFLEITFGVLKIAPVQFPFRNPTTGNWTLMDRRSQFVRPTLTHFYGVIQKVFRYLCRHWCDGTPLCKNLNRSALGVTIPLEGVCLRLAPDILASVHESLSIFTRPRPIRRSCDLARPVA